MCCSIRKICVWVCFIVVATILLFFQLGGNILGAQGMKKEAEKKEKGLVASWQFDEGKGKVAGDSSGNNNHGTIHKAKWVKGISGSALKFEGKGSYVNCGNKKDFNFGTGDFTMQAWFATVSRQNHNFLLAKNNFYLPHCWCLTVRSTGAFTFYTEGAGIGARSKVNDGFWHHVAIVREGKKGKFYLDGKLENESSNLFNKRDLANKYAFCISGPPTFEGIVDNVTIHNIALAEHEIKKQYLKCKQSIKQVLKPRPREIRPGKVISFVVLEKLDTQNAGDKKSSGMEENIKKINQLDPQPDFVMVMDNNFNASKNEETLKHIIDVERLCGKLRVPHYYTIGDHECVAIEKHKLLTWNKFLNARNMKERWYSFDIGDFHICVLDDWIGLNSEEYSSILKEQEGWLLKDLKSTSKKVIVFIHSLEGNFFENFFEANSHKIVAVFERKIAQSMWKIKKGITYHQVGRRSAKKGAKFTRVFIDPRLGTFYVQTTYLHSNLDKNDSKQHQTYGDPNVMKRFLAQQGK